MEAMLISYGKGVVESSIGKLGTLILNEALLIGSVREDILFIRDELQSMNAVMNDMIRAGSLNDQNKVWMLHVLQVACDAELCMDEFNDCLIKHRELGVIGASLRAGNFVRTIYPRYLVAKKIQKLKVQAMEVSQRHSRYTIAIPTKVTYTTESVMRAAIKRSDGMHFSHLMAEDTLAGNRSFRELQDKLKGDSSKVIAIVGPAGCGKTALAKMAYRRRNDREEGNYCKLEECFDKSAWITLPEKPDTKKVLEDILIQVDSSYKYREGDELPKQLESRLAGKSYLIVLDSVRTKKDWEAIKEALPKNPKGENSQDASSEGAKLEGGNPERDNPKGTILLTTRMKDVAEACTDHKENIIHVKIKSKDSIKLCRLMVLNIRSTWWDTILKLANPITNWFKKFQEPIILLLVMLAIIMFAMWGLRFVVHCIFHPVKTIMVIVMLILVAALLSVCGTIILTIVTLVSIFPILLMYNLFIWLYENFSNLFERGRLFHLTYVKGAPIDRVHTYVTLCTKQKPIFGFAPLAVKFICGALLAKDMNSHVTKELFENLQPLYEKVRQLRATEEAQLRAAEEARLRAAEEAPQRAEEGAQLAAEEGTRLAAEEGTRLAAGHEAPQGAENDTPHTAEAEVLQTTKQEMELIINDVIKCCYNILSHYSKKCAEDLNILPDGYSINRKRLVRRWVNLNILNAGPGLSIEQVAESYFDELMVKGFIDVESVNSCGNVKLCRINSSFKEYLKKDGQETSPHDKNKAFQLYDIQPSCTLTRVKKNLSSKYSPQSQTTYSVLKKSLKKKMSSHNKTQTISHSSYPQDIILESLTILDLEGCRGLKKEHLRFLTMCNDLKFLSLRNTDLTDIPKEIGQLKKLETLDVRQTPITCIPKDILQLSNLKHVWAGSIGKPESSTSDLTWSIKSIKVPAGMEEMSSLETLACVDATRPLLLGLREWTQLKKLGLVIRDRKLNSKRLCISLMMLCASLLSLSIIDMRSTDDSNSLEFLEYLCFPPLNLKSLTLKGYLERLPQWIGNHKHLAKLIIFDTKLRSDAIRLIGKIPTLLCLKLYRNSFREEVLTLEMKEFPVLQELIIHCDCIQKVSFQKGTTPSLKVFRWVLPTAQLKGFDGLGKLQMLKEVWLIGDVDQQLEEDMKKEVQGHTRLVSKIIRNIQNISETEAD